MKTFLWHFIFGSVGGAIFGAIVAKVFGYDMIRITLACCGAGIIGSFSDLWDQKT